MSTSLRPKHIRLVSAAALVALLLILSQLVLLSPTARATSPLTFTSGTSTRFQVGVAGSFSVQTSPSASVTLTATSLPSWLTLVDNGNGSGSLKGTPPAGSEGSHALTLVATTETSVSVSQSFTLFVDESPTITSADHATFTTGRSGSFTVRTTAGYPAATAISETGALPSGVSFSDNGNGTATLAGRPASGTAGTYHLTIAATAVGGSASHASQSFTLTVSEPTVTDSVAFTSAASAVFLVGTEGGFSVTTAASCQVTLTAESLPAWLHLVDNGNGTGSLVGTPPAGSQGSYSFTLVATTQNGTSVHQTVTLWVKQQLAITSSDHVTFTTGTAGSFTVTTAPAVTSVTITETGSLPSGVTFCDNGNGTATLAGTPAAGTARTYAITLVASATGPFLSATQHLTLTVNESAGNTSVAFTSAASTVFLVGTEGSFSVTTTASCPVTLTGDSLPAWLHLVDNGNGTGSLVGTPPAGSQGSYIFTLVATTQGGSTVHQTFTLWVKQQLAITSSDHVTFTTGTAGSFTVTTAPAVTSVTITETGSLPSGVTFTDHGNGTATMAGTPAAGTAGTYAITLVASATGQFLSASQHFTLTVSAPLMFTSADHVTFVVGSASSFTITTSGFPVPVICLSRALPSGVTFLDNGNGTATLSGTPAAGSGGAYTLFLTASNGVSPTAMQALTLYVDQAPAITSSDHAAFSVGTAGSFTVTTTAGFPTPVLSATGTFPEGVGFTDNRNGTGTLAGTPSATGTFTLRITAQSGSAPAAVQELTVTVAPAAGQTQAAGQSLGTSSGSSSTELTSSSGLLARTGADIDPRLPMSAVAMMLLGGILVAVGRRRPGHALAAGRRFVDPS
jgi:large repetitive protein